jgi:hypothetical protein
MSRPGRVLAIELKMTAVARERPGDNRLIEPAAQVLGNVFIRPACNGIRLRRSR